MQDLGPGQQARCSPEKLEYPERCVRPGFARLITSKTRSSLRFTPVPTLLRLQTPIYAHYPPPTIACFSILLSTRLLCIPLPKDWWILFDADYDDMWVACGHITRLWRDWGSVEGGDDRIEGEVGDGLKEARWRRAWQLSVSRKYVRRYVERMEQGEDPALPA